MSRVTETIDAALHRLDRAQKRHGWSSFPVAVVKKFGDDQAGRLAALISYYAFFSIFPLMLVLVTVLGYLLRDNQQLRQSIVDSAISQFPVIGTKIEKSVHALRGSLPALLFGIVTSLWSGMAVVNSIQNAMDEVWYIPKARRLGFVPRIARGALILLTLGGMIAVSGSLAAVATSTSEVSPIARVISFAVPVVVDAAFLGTLFKWLPARHLSWSEVLPGAILGAVAWETLIVLGAFLIDRRIRGATELYGFFGVVIGLLSWLFLGAQILLIAAEVNVVRAERLWPRSLFPPPLEDSDRRALAERAEVEQARPEQAVHVHFDGSESRPRSG